MPESRSPSVDFVNAPNTPREPARARKFFASITSWIKETASGLSIPLVGKKGDK